MSRPQVGITRITPRRVSLEPRESMNCKSCRKRKVRFVLQSLLCQILIGPLDQMQSVAPEL